MKHIQTYESFINEVAGIINFDSIDFNSHKKHNPSCDIVVGHINPDAFITYGIYVKGPEIGTEFMEYYSGPNYKPAAGGRSHSRMYTPANVPQKYLPYWQALKAEYETKYKNQTYEDFLNEGESTLYKLTFKLEYLNDDNKPQAPIFCSMQGSERTTIAAYAAIDKIGGYGNTEFNDVSARDRIGATYMEYKDLRPLVKSLQRVKIYR